MPANGHKAKDHWGDSPTVILPAYRTLYMGHDGPLVHVTPYDYHVVDMDCDGVCLTCNHPLESLKS